MLLGVRGEIMTNDYLINLRTMFNEIKEAYDNEKDPLARCELAKGYCVIGKELANYGLLK